MKVIGKIAIFSLIASSCGLTESNRSSTKIQPETDPAQTTLQLGGSYIAPKLMWNNDSWSDLVMKRVRELGLASENPTDIAQYCPQYTDLNSEQRVAFYGELMAAMAKRESNYNTNLKFTESFVDSNGENVISRGLFQISIESASLRPYDCKLPNDANVLHDPQVNIECSANILGNWIKKDKYIGVKIGDNNLGGARYWSVLRSNSSTEFIQTVTKKYCTTLVEKAKNESLQLTAGTDTTTSSEVVLKLNDGRSVGRPELKPQVLEMQKRLVALGYGVTADGYYGEGTKVVIAKFLANNNLEGDGSIVERRHLELMKTMMN